jgi:hypothetical protein
MKVWILLRKWYYQGDEVVDVYESAEAAERDKVIYTRIADTRSDFEVLEMEIKK